MTVKRSLIIVQMNDTHAYFDIHQEILWQGDHAEYRLLQEYLCGSIRMLVANV